MLSKTPISFIGAGNMARSIIGGLIAQGVAPGNITASDPNEASLQVLRHDFQIHTTGDNTTACAGAQAVVLAVKPQVIGAVCRALAPQLKPGCLVISIAAGINCQSLQHWLGTATPVVRCMPNTPALVKTGASALYANAAVSESQRELAAALMAAVGLVQWLPEEGQMDAVTAVSGSGPAYFFLLMEAMVDAGEQLGLERDLARALAVQTARGAAELAAQSDRDLAELRRQVTSPGGTTERALEVFENRQLRAIVQAAMTACSQRSTELAQVLGEP